MTTYPESDYLEYLFDPPFLWIDLRDESSSQSYRAYLKRNAIALVSNYRKDSLDPRSGDLLECDSPRIIISDSDLWNINHVGEQYNAAFLDRLADAVEETSEL